MGSLFGPMVSNYKKDCAWTLRLTLLIVWRDLRAGNPWCYSVISHEESLCVLLYEQANKPKPCNFHTSHQQEAGMVVTAVERMWDRKVRKGRGYRLPKPVMSCNGIRDTSMARSTFVTDPESGLTTQQITAFTAWTKGGKGSFIFHQGRHAWTPRQIWDTRHPFPAAIKVIPTHALAQE